MYDDRHIFLSYSSDDLKFARRLRNDLVKRGFNIWMDKTHIPGGHHWDDTIEEALANAKLLILLISPSSVKSQNVRDEMDYALDQEHPVPQVPIMYKKTKLPLTWRRLQYIELNEKNYQKNFPVLVEQIKRHLAEEKDEKDTGDLRTSEKNYIVYFLAAALLIVTGIVSYLLISQNSQTKLVSNKEELKNRIVKHKTAVDNVHTVHRKDTDTATVSLAETVKKPDKTPPKDSANGLPVKVVPDTQKKHKEAVVERKRIPVTPSAESIEEPKKASKKDIVRKSSSFQKSQQTVSGIIHTPDREVPPAKPESVEPKVKGLDVNAFKNIPYDRDGIVLSFVKKLNQKEPVKLQVRGYAKEGDISDKARDRVNNVVRLLKKRGLRRSDIERKIVFTNEENREIEYSIVEE